MNAKELTPTQCNKIRSILIGTGLNPESKEYQFIRNEFESLQKKQLTALKFYANRDNYLTIHAENPTPNVVMDDGELARKTLKDLGE